MEPDSIVRQARSTDAAALFVLNEKFNGKSAVTEDSIALSIGSNDQEHVFVAELNRNVIGFCCVQIFKSFCYDTSYCEITELYIDEDYQNKGIGTQLINYIEKHFENTEIKGFQLFTGGENYRAQSFYEKLGYKKSSEIMYRKRR